jgi:uncharacterized membrane protein
MRSRAQIGNHPIHPMLVPLPIGLWVFSLVCDVVYAMGWGGPAWSVTALYTMLGGIVGALLAAPFGLVDFLGLRDPRARRIGAAHLVLNLVVVAMFAVNLWLRMRSEPGAALPIVLSAIGNGMLVVSGWLGGELVYRLGVAVEPAVEIRVGTKAKETAA